MSRFAAVIVLFLISSAAVLAEYPVKPVPFTNVKIDDSFWSPRQKINHEHSIPFAFEQCEKTGRLENFKLVAGKAKPGYKYIQPIFNDTDIYKGIEAASYDLAVNPDPKMEAYLDTLIVAVAEAQQPDGYLYTALTCGQDVKNDFGAKTSDGKPTGRWEDLQMSHELYCAGHLFEAATAHYAATGKRNFLDVAIKLADLLVKTFGYNEGQIQDVPGCQVVEMGLVKLHNATAKGKIQDVPGHEVVEMGLAKMHEATGNGDYLKLAKFFVDMRGRQDLRNSKSIKGPKTMYGAYAQDDIPLADHNEAVGHAVRAGYFYAGATDVAVLTGDTKTIDALHRVWDNVVTKKLSLNGGLGATPHGEAFDKNYVLPNEYRQTYNETCAQIAGCYWYQRMFL
ncbi:MAG: glycoside hydrolase family 127 protein, partial [Planctomycetaceae bacterium]|nr:glycoside hydrolase family 127 protein [Planctomycetaceae bacterium]